MKFSTISSSLLFAASAVAVPLVPAGYTTALRRDSPGHKWSSESKGIVEFVFQVESFESAFYQLLNSDPLNAAAFAAAGFPSGVRDRYLQVQHNEATHLELFRQALQELDIEPLTCKYDFSTIKSVNDFVAASGNFEAVGAGMYAGALPSVAQDADAITIGATIAEVEARQAAWIHGQVLSKNPWNAPFETPLTQATVATLVKPFIASCDQDITQIIGFNETFTPLSVDLSQFSQTGKATFHFSPADNSENAHSDSLYVTYLNGMTVTSVDLDPKTYEAEIPTDELFGLTFAFVTSAKGSFEDSSVISGPALIDLAFDAQGKLLPF